MLSCPLAHGDLNKTYPTAATTNLRVETYVDSIGTISKSTQSVEFSTWTYLTSTLTYIPSNQSVQGVTWDIKGSTINSNPLNGIKASTSNGLIKGYLWVIENSTYTVKETTWTLKEYTDIVIKKAKIDFINEVLDNDVEQYMVWGDTTTLPAPGSWKGWCLSYVNKKPVPIICP